MAWLCNKIKDIFFHLTGFPLTILYLIVLKEKNVWSGRLFNLLSWVDNPGKTQPWTSTIIHQLYILILLWPLPLCFAKLWDLGLFSVVPCFPHVLHLPIPLCLYFEFSFLSKFCLRQVDSRIWLFPAWTPYWFLKLSCYLNLLLINWAIWPKKNWK